MFTKRTIIDPKDEIIDTAPKELLDDYLTHNFDFKNENSRNKLSSLLEWLLIKTSSNRVTAN